jgi:hypothetical protein
MNLDSVLKATGGFKGCAMFGCINKEEGMLTFCHSCLAVLAAYLACSTLVVCGQRWSGSPCGCQSLGEVEKNREARVKDKGRKVDSAIGRPCAKMEELCGGITRLEVKQRIKRATKGL